MIYFTKMQGTGNDFIIINNLKNQIIYDYSKLSEYLCNRHFGIGADGVIFLEESFSADYKMRIFNSDGSEAEMCGNGIRCFAKYLYQNKITNNNNINIETQAGIKDVKLIMEGKKVSFVKVNMGKPILEYNEIPVIYENKKAISIENREVYPISIGNPHAICFEKEIGNINIEKEGSKIENYKYFPNKTNVEFVNIIDKNNIEIRVWERGVGETMACGTGACASAYMSSKIKNLESIINVKLKGGNLKVEYKENEGNIYLEGEAETVFTGEIDI